MFTKTFLQRALRAPPIRRALAEETRMLHCSKRLYNEKDSGSDEGKRKYDFKKNLQYSSNPYAPKQAAKPETSEERKRDIAQDEKLAQEQEVNRTRKSRVAALVVFAVAVAFYLRYVDSDDFKKRVKQFKNSPDEPVENKYTQVSPEDVEKELNIHKIDRTVYKITDPNGSDVPGVYISGNNENKLVNDGKSTKYQLVFKRLPFFDKLYAKYVALGDSSGALVDENGDLRQWGKGFGGDNTKPTVTGEKLVKAVITHGTVYGLKSNGKVVYLPESAEAQKSFSGVKQGWTGSSSTNFRTLDTHDSIADIANGKDHIVLLTTDGAVYTAAAGYDKPVEKSWGQYGLPTLSQFDAAPPINELQDVTLLNKYVEDGIVHKRKITQIAAGDYFTLALDSMGTVWAWGRNTFGCVGKEMQYNTEVIPYPSKVDVRSTHHFKKNEMPRCINIAAGGDTAFATYVSSNLYHLFEKSVTDRGNFSMEELTDNEAGSAKSLAWGSGLKGQLGSGRFIHGQAEPSQVKDLDELKEYNETEKKVQTIGIKSWSVGGSHVDVTLNNGDVYVWGDNEYGQLGSGKRVRAARPTMVPSLLEPNEAQREQTPGLNDRLQLVNNDKYEQVLVTGPDTSAIYYKKH